MCARTQQFQVQAAAAVAAGGSSFVMLKNAALIFATLHSCLLVACPVDEQADCLKCMPLLQGSTLASFIACLAHEGAPKYFIEVNTNPKKIQRAGLDCGQARMQLAHAGSAGVAALTATHNVCSNHSYNIQHIQVSPWGVAASKD
eukprot:1161114-Pelagomonas_calceolata.AAC.5